MRQQALALDDSTTYPLQPVLKIGGFKVSVFEMFPRACVLRK